MSQTVEEYPNNVITRQPADGSNGSFGPVFAVLAVIVVVSAVACVLGRLCGRRSRRGKDAGQKPAKAGKPSHQQQQQGLGPKEWETRQKPSFNMSDGDIEFGFDFKKSGSGKGGKNGGGKAAKPLPPQFNGNGGRKPDVRFADGV